MRVLVVSHGHPSFSIGGAEVASYNLHLGLNAIPDTESHYLARVGPPVARHRGTALMSLRQKEREALFWANDYDHFRLSNRNLETLEQDFVRYVADVRPDVVHFHHFLGLGVETVFAIRKHFPDIAIVVTLHEYLAICHHHGQMVKTGGKATLCTRSSPAECAMCFPQIAAAEFMKRELFLKTFFDMVDHFVSPSQFLIERFVDWGLPREKCSFIENGLVLNEIAPPRPLPKGGRRNRFAYFGQVTRFKGVQVLLDAITRVPDDVWGEDSSVAFFGGNLENQPQEFQTEFKALMDRAGRRARFYGPYRAPEIATLMKDIDYVIVPSIWWENSPLVIQEAFAHGRPIICSNIGGMAEKVRNGVDGLHFRVGSVEDLVDRFTQTLSEPQLWDKLRAKIRRPLGFEDCARLHTQLYRKLVRARAPMPMAANG
ncbi:MAG: glycosyltransferase family 4 protein [Solirubrobacterales bacterium]